MITIETLEKMPSGDTACSDSRKWFMETFPDGATLRAAWDACENDEWRVWFVANFIKPTAAVELAKAFVDNDVKTYDVYAYATYLASIRAATDADAYAAYLTAYLIADAYFGTEATVNAWRSMAEICEEFLFLGHPDLRGARST